MINCIPVAEAKEKKLKRGRKEIQKAIRKNVRGVMVLAADISPVDVVSNLPVLCEEHNIPYVWVPSREELGAAAGTKRATSCVLIPSSTSDSSKEKLSEVSRAISKLAADSLIA